MGREALDFKSAAEEAVRSGNYTKYFDGAGSDDSPPVDEKVATAVLLLAELDSRLKADVGAAFKPDVLKALGTVQRYDPATWTRTKLVLQKHRVSLRVLQKEIHKTWAGEDREDSEQQLQLAGDKLPDCPAANMVVPEGYKLDEDGIYESKSHRDVLGTVTASTVVLAHAPLVISGRLRDVDTGAHFLQIHWRRSDGWRQLIVDRGVALDKNRIVPLAAEDFPVSSNNAAALTRYLEGFESLNYDKLPTAQVTSHLGWQGRNGELGFLVGHTLITPTAKIIQPPDTADTRNIAFEAGGISFRGQTGGDLQIVDAFRARGTMDGWLRGVSVLADHPRALVGLYASFVPPMLSIVCAPNFIIDWAQRTSVGKTTILRVAASVWGNPNDNEPDAVIHSWDSTQVYIERAAGIVSGLPLILDETKRVKKPNLVANTLYEVAAGQGRGRGNTRSTAATPTFRTVLLSTGEMPAVCFTQDGGTRTRCLEIRGLPFGSASKDTAAIVRGINSAVTTNYGHAGIEFVRQLILLRDQWPRLEEEYRAKIQYFREQAPKEADPAIVDRLAQSVAAVSLVANYAHAALDLPWEFNDPMEELWPEILAEAADAAGEERALRDVVSWAHSHEQSFCGRHASFGSESQPRMPTEGWAGRWDREKWQFIGFLETVIKTVLVDHGYAPEAILAAWKERGWLVVDNDRDRYTTRQRMFGDRPHLVAIRAEVILALEGGDSGDGVGTVVGTR